MTKAEVAEEIDKAMPDVDLKFRPSPHQWPTWRAWIDVETGTDDMGNFLAWCPLHCAVPEGQTCATINFFKGVLRCEADPSCHAPKRAMSLINVMARLP
jgi:hypothetical protein